MDLALGRPALAVAAGALALLIVLMRTVPMTNSTGRHFSTLPRPPTSLKQFGAYLKAKDATIFVLQRPVKTSENKRLTQEAIRNYENTGRSGFHFPPDDVGDLLDTFVIPHIRDLDDQRYFQNLDITSAEAEDLSRAFSITA